MISRLLCWWKGHRRGKRIGQTAIIKCPRCGAEWIRESRPKLA